VGVSISTGPLISTVGVTLNFHLGVIASAHTPSAMGWNDTAWTRANATWTRGCTTWTQDGLVPSTVPRLRGPVYLNATRGRANGGPRIGPDLRSKSSKYKYSLAPGLCWTPRHAGLGLGPSRPAYRRGPREFQSSLAWPIPFRLAIETPQGTATRRSPETLQRLYASALTSASIASCKSLTDATANQTASVAMYARPVPAI